MKLVDAIARRLDIEEAREPGLEELKQDVAPEQVLREIEQEKDEGTGAAP